MQVRNLLFQRADRTLMAGASITIYLTGTQTLATLFQADGATPLSNPFHADGYGRASVAIVNGLYDITASAQGVTVSMSKEAWLDVTGALNSVNTSTAAAQASAAAAQAAANAAQGYADQGALYKVYATKAAATADVGNIPANAWIRVQQDESITGSPRSDYQQVGAALTNRTAVENAAGTELVVGAANRSVAASLLDKPTVVDYGADATGVGDSTAAFEAAIAAHPRPYVPPGNFAVTSLPNFGVGFWGDGNISIAGHPFIIPSAPRLAPLARSIRQGLARSTHNYGVLAVVGDSRAAHYLASSEATSWFDMLQKTLNQGVADGSEPVITDFDDNGNPPSFYGITLAGSYSYGSGEGPVGVPLILHTGASISVTGAYSEVDVFYTQQPGAGTLAFSWNGGAAFKTVNCAGSTTIYDASTFSSPSGNSGSGTTTITNTGSGDVHITGLIRFTNATGVDKPVLCFKFAKGSMPTSVFAADEALLSSATQMKYLSGGVGRPTVIVQPIANNMINPTYYTTPASAKADLIKIYNYYQSQCNAIVIPLGPVRPGPGWTISPGYQFEDFLAAFLEACEECGLKPCRLDDIPLDEMGLFVDHLHASDAGQLVELKRIMEHMAEVVPSTGSSGYASYVPSLTRDTGTVTNTYGPRNSASYRIDGQKVLFTFAIDITTTDSGGSGTFRIPLPVPADTTVGCAGQIGAITGFTFPAGDTQAGLVVDDNANAARILGMNLGAGVNVPTAVANGALIIGQIEYKAGVT